jgi:hypothetical protein
MQVPESFGVVNAPTATLTGPRPHVKDSTPIVSDSWDEFKINIDEKAGDYSAFSRDSRTFLTLLSKMTPQEVELLDPEPQSEITLFDKMLFRLTHVSDEGFCSHAFVCSTPDMIKASASASNTEPILLLALRQVGGLTDVQGKYLAILEKAFKATTGKAEYTPPMAVQGYPDTRKSYPTATGDVVSDLLTIQLCTRNIELDMSSTSSVHTVSMCSVRVTKMPHAYTAVQSATVVEKSKRPSNSAEKMILTYIGQTRQINQEDCNKFTPAHQESSISDDKVAKMRISTIHVFTAGRHFTGKITHMQDENVHSLHAPVYAMIKRLQETENIPDDTWGHGYMETIYTAPSIPMVVSRSTDAPFVAIFESHDDVARIDEPVPGDFAAPDFLEARAGEENGWVGTTEEEDETDKEEEDETDEEEKGIDEDEKGSDGEEKGTDEEQKGTDEDEKGTDEEEKGTGEEEVGTDEEEVKTDEEDSEAGNDEKSNITPITQTMRFEDYPEGVRLALARHWSMNDWN